MRSRARSRCDLKDVPWDQALDIVLKTKGLDKRVQGNVLLVAPAAELADQERAQLENEQEIAELAPLRTELIKVKYANASDIVALFSSQGNDDQITLARRHLLGLYRIGGRFWLMIAPMPLL